MGNLAKFLQSEFVRLCPVGWRCQTEQRLLAPAFEQQMGYSSRVDLLLRREDGTRQLWIEFEVSRADPVANHAKFSVAHLFQPQLESDTFVSMISPRVDYGRANLAGNMITLMREIGMQAFQIPLVPYLSATTINALNKLSQAELMTHGEIEAQRELDRVFAVVEPAFTVETQRIHFASNLLEVMLNVRIWNAEIHQAAHSARWGKRTISYFVFDPITRLFAPAKFCAYVALKAATTTGHSTSNVLGSGMNIALYTSLDAHEKLFDGARAHSHLTRNLTMQLIPRAEADHLANHFDRWLHSHKAQITLHSRGPIFLVPPEWFGKKKQG